MWLEQIDKKNNHKINIFCFFCFLKRTFPYTLSLNLTELLSWTEQMLLGEELWLDHKGNVEPARP